MKYHRMSFLLLILGIFILSCFTIIYFNLKKEKYQPLDSLINVGPDVFKYLILSELSLEELNNFAFASKFNFELVQNYLQIFTIPLTLKTVNNLNYFEEYPLPDLSNTMFGDIIHERNKSKSSLSLLKLNELFDILNVNLLFTLNLGDDKKISIVDHSNIKRRVKRNPFQKKLEDETIEMSVRDNEEEQKIHVFISLKCDAYPDLFKKLKEFNDSISKITNDGSFKFHNHLMKYIKLSPHYGWCSFSFSFPNIKRYSPLQGYDIFKNLFPKKKGISSLNFQIEEKKED